MLIPFNFFCLCSLFLSVLIVASSSSLYLCWVGLELNLLSFIPLILSSKMSQRNSEGAMKYFLVQALSSVIMLFSICFLCSHLSFFVLGGALLFKMAAAPFHFWLLALVETLAWDVFFLLLTIQKIGPLIFLSFFTQEVGSLLIFFTIVSILVGALGGLSQLMFRSILAYSSINHLGWLLSSLLIGRQFSFIYLFLYMVVLMSLTMIFSMGSFFHLNQVGSLESMTLKFMVFLGLLSVGGLPPFLGFLPKWLVLSKMIEADFYFVALILVMGSLFTLYYYVRLTFPVFMFSSSSFFSVKRVQFELNWSIFFSCLSLGSLPFFLLLI